MPAMHYRLQWPDGHESTCYSPSLVIKDFFEPGHDYPLPDFLKRLREATRIASDRVEAKFGFACSRAMDQLATVERRAAGFSEQPAAKVRMLGFDDTTSSAPGDH